MIVGDAIHRIDEVLGEKPLSESRTNHIPYDNSITLEHVSYSYDGEKQYFINSVYCITYNHCVLTHKHNFSKRCTNNWRNFQTFQKCNRQLRNVGNCIHKSTSSTHDVLYNCNQRRICFWDFAYINISYQYAPFLRVKKSCDNVCAAQCQDIIEKLPKGVDTVVGTKGVYLSGGEQQRNSAASE